MRVRVWLFAAAKQLAEADFVEIDLPAGATVGLLRQRLAACCAPLGPLARHMLFAVDYQYVHDETIVPPEAEVACIPPVSGG
ncbi:MAG TPA: MoaD/ThiS family protein [Pirellulales bacterium]|jgi:molybdopterin converting factor small subunit|nr:MoaD/ThiS family protein [Pirellulales bacterium]